jgi:hypothetical protein
MKRRIRFWCLFFDYLGSQNYYEGIDKGHWYKTRIGFKTAWKLAKIFTS